MRLFAIASFFTFIVSQSTACSHDHGEAYDTYQECFDDHTTVEKLAFQEAVTVCCSEHEIAGKMPACGATSAECVTYLGANLTSTATAAEVQAACDDYITKTGM